MPVKITDYQHDEHRQSIAVNATATPRSASPSLRSLRSINTSSESSHHKRPLLGTLPLNIHDGYSSVSGRPISFIIPFQTTTKFYKPSFLNNLNLFIKQTISFTLSSFFLILVVVWAILADISKRLPGWLRPVEPVTFPWDDHKRWKSEKCVKDVRYYAREAGFEIVNEEVETEDGYFLRYYLQSTITSLLYSMQHVIFSFRIHRVVNPRHRLNANSRGSFYLVYLIYFNL